MYPKIHPVLVGKSMMILIQLSYSGRKGDLGHFMPLSDRFPEENEIQWGAKREAIQ